MDRTVQLLTDMWNKLQNECHDVVTEENHDALKKAIEALEQQPCDPRQAVIVMCKDCRKHNVSVGYQKDCCPLYEFRGISYGHEHDYQFCCFAERRTDERSN